MGRDGTRLAPGHGNVHRCGRGGALDQHLRREPLAFRDSLHLERDRVDGAGELVVANLGDDRGNVDRLTERATDGTLRAHAGAEPGADAADEERDPTRTEEQNDVTVANWAVKQRVKDLRPHRTTPPCG